jgi:hypothetical protein
MVARSFGPCAPAVLLAYVSVFSHDLKRLGQLTKLATSSFLDDRVGADGQHPRRVTNATRVHGHVDDLPLDLRRLTWVGIVQEEGATRAAFFSAAVPLLALPGLAMADDIRAVTVGTV